MQMMARSCTYDELLGQLKGKKVLVWTCNTCARLCGIGGTDNALALSEKLRQDGVEVVGTGATGASCIASNIRKSQIPETPQCDVVLALTCDIGSKLSSKVFGKPSINPITTFGTGYRDDDKVYWMMGRDGKDDTPLLEETERRKLYAGPFAESQKSQRSRPPF
jgi:hypothetical protein